MELTPADNLDINDQMIPLSSPSKDSESNEILYFSINQENNCIAVATKLGFKIFATEPFELFYEHNCGPINIVEMLYTTNLVLLVGLTDFGDFSPKKVTIFSTSQNQVICSSYSFSGNISVAKINKDRMAVGERSFIHIYSIGNMKIMKTINAEGHVSLGKMILSSNSIKNNYLIYSSSKDEGVVQIYDTLVGEKKHPITAHKSPILKMCLNTVGDRLATCSCKGTIIRIFAIPSGEKLITYKRGINSAFIFSMNFSNNSDKLITTSDAGTLHIFDIKKEEDSPQQYKGVQKTINRVFVTIAGKIMPKDYEDSFGTEGASLIYNSDIMKISNIVSFNPKDPKQAFCFTSDGSFYQFYIDYVNKKISKVYERNMKELKIEHS